MRLLSFVFTLILFFGSALAQQKIGNVSYTAPKGWTSSSVQGGVQYTHKSASGVVDGAIMVGQDMPVPDDPAGWVEAKALSLLPGDPIKENPVQSEKLPSGLTSTYKVVVGGSGQQPLFYVVALLHNSSTGMLIVLLTGDAQKLEGFVKEAESLMASVKFTGTPTTAATTTPASGTTTTLPEVKPMNAAQFKAAGGDPDRQFIPDEFRCYAQRKGEGLTPELVVQVLPGGQYRTKYGSGTLKVVKNWDFVAQGGPLDGADGNFWFNRYGQSFELNDVGETEDEYGVDFQCYQRGPRENLALFEFKLKTPKPGTYPCTLDDGTGKANGTLTIQAGGAYSLDGQGGRFTTNYRGRQSDAYSSLDFRGGPLDNRLGSYEEDEYGLREVSFTRPSMTCQSRVTPTPFPSQYGTGKAPAPPGGSGGLSGNWVHSRAGTLRNGLQMGPDFTLIPTLDSECPGNMCWEFLFFNKNGYVYTLEPDESLSEADCSRTYANGLPVCEVYRVTGNKIQIGSDKAVPFKQQGKTFTLDGRDYDQLMPLDNLKLEGQFKSTVVSNAVVSLGGSISNSALYFNTKNQFAYDRSSSTNLAGSGYVMSSSNQAATRRGTYQFKGNTLELKYADGRLVRMFAVTTLDEKGKLDLTSLRLGGGTYILQKSQK